MDISKKVNKINKIFKSMDLISKLLIVLLLLILFVYIFDKISFFSKNIESEKKLLEVADTKDISVVDYSFDSNTKVRWPEDMYLIINFSKVLSQEEKDKFSFEISPVQDFETKFPNDYTLVVSFTKPSPKDGSYSNFKILYEGKQLKNIQFLNSDKSTAVDAGARTY